MAETLTVDDLTFTVRRSPRRASIGISVERDGSLCVTAPEGCPPDLLEQAVRAKQFWVYTKLAQKQILSHPSVSRSFVDGEGFLYLGRSYRLRLIDPPAPKSGEVAPPLRLTQGRFLLRRDARARAREHFVDWYGAHARLWIAGRLPHLAERIGATTRGLAIRDLGYRWGSCGSGGGLNFHWRCILLPPRIVDYVIVHELVHLIEPHHNVTFWQRVLRVLPDYEERRRWLAEEGGRFDLGEAVKALGSSDNMTG